MFLHAGLLHLLFNMFSLYLFGPELEKLAGKLRFLTIYFMAGLFGTVATFLLQELHMYMSVLVVLFTDFSEHLVHLCIMHENITPTSTNHFTDHRHQYHHDVLNTKH